MDKAYSTEAREGETMALGHCIPPLKRAMLNVFLGDEREKRKEKLALETCWREARAITAREPAADSRRGE